MNSTTAYQERVSIFFEVLNQKFDSHREAARLLDRFLSTRFNVFTIFKPDENRLSDIIADLLDPHGSHGQGRVFLDSFLQRIGICDLSPGKPPRIVREHATSYISTSARRIDVTIDFGDFCLGIENKPWAGEQPKQIEDYREHLLRKHATRFCLVYVTPAGSRPSSLPDETIETELRENRLRLLSYNSDILGWLEESIQSCSSDKFRWFLRDFANYVREFFPVSPPTEVNDGNE